MEEDCYCLVEGYCHSVGFLVVDGHQVHVVEEEVGKEDHKEGVVGTASTTMGRMPPVVVVEEEVVGRMALVDSWDVGAQNGEDVRSGDDEDVPNDDGSNYLALALA